MSSRCNVSWCMVRSRASCTLRDRIWHDKRDWRGCWSGLSTWRMATGTWMSPTWLLHSETGWLSVPWSIATDPTSC